MRHTWQRLVVVITVLALTLVLGLSVARAQAPGPLIVGNNASAGNGPIQTWDFSLPGSNPPLAQFVPFGAIPTSPFPNVPNGRGVAVLDNEVYYTELTVNLCCATDFIRVAQFNGGAGPPSPVVDKRTLPNPRPGCGIADLAFSRGVLYALVGYPGAVIPGSCPSGLEVWMLNPVTGAPLSPPASITNPFQPGGISNSDGFTVLPNGNFLINNFDTSCTYNEYSPSGSLIPAPPIVVPGGFCTGVDTDGVSLYFQEGANSFVQTDLAGMFIASASVSGENQSVEDISLVHVSTGRMTGGGSVFTTAGVRVTHGFELPCDATQNPANLEVNWGRGNNFHLTSLTSAHCFDDPGIMPDPPAAGFDTYIGSGVGLCNGLAATATWTLTDAGEPGNSDSATINIIGIGGCSLAVSGNLQNGNQQAHAP